MLGDFNLGNINWCWSEDEKRLMPCDLHLDCEYLLVDCLFSLNLTQINDVKNNLGRILDLSNSNSNSDTNRTNFYRIRKEYEFLNKYLYNNYINQAEQNIKCDSKAFWKFINSKRGNSGIPNNLTFNGQSYSALQSMILLDFLVQFMMNLIQIVRT